MKDARLDNRGAEGIVLATDSPFAIVKWDDGEEEKVRGEFLVSAKRGLGR